MHSQHCSRTGHCAGGGRSCCQRELGAALIARHRPLVQGFSAHYAARRAQGHLRTKLIHTVTEAGVGWNQVYNLDETALHRKGKNAKGKWKMDKQVVTCTLICSPERGDVLCQLLFEGALEHQSQLGLLQRISSGLTLPRTGPRPRLCCSVWLLSTWKSRSAPEAPWSTMSSCLMWLRATAQPSSRMRWQPSIHIVTGVCGSRDYIMLSALRHIIHAITQSGRQADCQRQLRTASPQQDNATRPVAQKTRAQSESVGPGCSCLSEALAR